MCILIFFFFYRLLKETIKVKATISSHLWCLSEIIKGTLHNQKKLRMKIKNVHLIRNYTSHGVSRSQTNEKQKLKLSSSVIFIHRVQVYQLYPDLFAINIRLYVTLNGYQQHWPISISFFSKHCNKYRNTNRWSQTFTYSVTNHPFSKESRNKAVYVRWSSTVHNVILNAAVV